MVRMVIFASGGGSNFAEILKAQAEGALPAEVVSLFTNRSSCGAMDIGRAHDVDVFSFAKANFADLAERDQAIHRQLEAIRPDIVVLAGYLAKVASVTVNQFFMVNTHPSLLPKYGGEGMYGDRVHRAVLEAGDSVTGVTLHRVTENFDEGPILDQVEVPVLPGDTLEDLRDRVKSTENQFIVRALCKIIKEL